MKKKKIGDYVYRVTDRLGKGTFSEVFKAALDQGEGQFAIKVI
jgi:hypothetical protein